MKLFGSVLRVAETLPCTGMAVDKTFFIPLTTARRIAGRKLGIGPRDISGVLVKLRDRGQMDFVAELLEYMMDGVRVVKVPAMVRRTAERVRFVERLVGAALAALAVCGVALLGVSSRLSMEGRRRDIALMRSLGAARGRVVTLAAMEMALLGAAGALPGAAVGLAVSRAAQGILVSGLEAPFVAPGFGLSAAVAVGIAFAALAAAAAAGAAASWSVAGMPPDTALRE